MSDTKETRATGPVEAPHPKALTQEEAIALQVSFCAIQAMVQGIRIVDWDAVIDHAHRIITYGAPGYAPSESGREAMLSLMRVAQAMRVADKAIAESDARCNCGAHQRERAGRN